MNTVRNTLKYLFPDMVNIMCVHMQRQNVNVSYSDHQTVCKGGGGGRERENKQLVPSQPEPVSFFCS